MQLELGDLIERLVRKLAESYKDETGSLEIAEALASLGSPGLEVLLALLEEDLGKASFCVVDVICKRIGKAARRHLERAAAIEGLDQDLAHYMAAAAAKLGSKAGTQRVLRFLRKAEAGVGSQEEPNLLDVEEALEALCVIRDPEVTQFLRSLANGQSPLIHPSPTLKAKGGDFGAMRFQLRARLALIYHEKGISGLEELHRDTTAPLADRLEAIHLAGSIGSECLPLVLEALDSPEEDLRLTAADSLQGIAQGWPILEQDLRRKAVQAALKLLDGPRTKITAADTLAHLEATEALPELRGRLKSEKREGTRLWLNDAIRHLRRVERRRAQAQALLAGGGNGQ